MKTFNNYINGKEVAAQDGRTTPVIDPVTGKQYANAALSGPADVDSAIKAAADAFESWKHSTPSVRQKAINDIADAMEANMTELIEAEIENTGKPRLHIACRLLGQLLVLCDRLGLRLLCH